MNSDRSTDWRRVSVAGDAAIFSHLGSLYLVELENVSMDAIHWNGIMMRLIRNGNIFKETVIFRSGSYMFFREIGSMKVSKYRVLLLGHGSKWESWQKFFSRYSALYGNSVISYNRLSFLTLLFSSGPFVPNSDWQRIVRRPRMLFFSPATELIPLLILRSRSVPVERGPRETSGFTDQTRLSSLHNSFVAWYSYVVRLDDDIQNSKLKYSNLKFRLH